MPKVTFTVATDFNFYIPGIKFKNPVPVTEAFSKIIAPITTGRLFKEDGVLKCEADLSEEYIYSFPCVFCNLHLENIVDKIITKCKVTEIGLCFSENQDPAIKSIYKQLDFKSIANILGDKMSEPLPDKEIEVPEELSHGIGISDVVKDGNKIISCKLDEVSATRNNRLNEIP